ncbi:MAG TPA: 50S ribosomal protein L2 [Candidatus Paceibacterota bacterium]
MKTYKPTSKSRRGMTVVHYRSLLSGHSPHKALVKGGKRFQGKATWGRITVRHQGGGHKQLFRDVDFVYDKKDIPARIESVEYDPGRSGFISLACYADGVRRYVLTPVSMKVGDKFSVSEKAEIKVGNRLPLSKIPTGTFVYNIEIEPAGGAKLVRSAGVFAEVLARDGGFVNLRLPSTEVRKVDENSWASIGSVSNPENMLTNYGKAGRSRWKGIRPTVRGSAMNPVDHPYGGGEGRQGRGTKRAKTRWGKPSGKGQKTRHPRKHSNVFIVSRRKVGKSRKA